LDKQITSSSNNTKNSRLYYGYGILAACFFIMTMVSGAQASFGVFFKPMISEFGWTRASTALPFSLNLILSGVFGIFAGRLSDRLGPRVVVAVGGIIMGAGYILMSRITNLSGLYLTYGFLVALGSSAMYVPLVSMVTRWFPHRRGLMVGIGISGIGFGIGVVPTIASQIMISHDWRESLLLVGAVSAVLIAVLAQILKPQPDPQLLDDAGKGKKSLPLPDIGIPFNQALKTRQFWMIFTSWLLYGFFYQVGAVHAVPYATDIGMSALAATSLLTIIGLVGIAGRSTLGYTGDKFSNKATLAVGFILMAAAFIGLAVFRNVGMLYGYAIIYGMFSGVGVVLASINAEHFGLQSLGAITRAIVFGNNLGGAIGPALAGYIYDKQDSYRLAFILCGLAGIAAGITIWSLKPTSKQKNDTSAADGKPIF
jgi:MFS family permease